MNSENILAEQLKAIRELRAIIKAACVPWARISRGQFQNITVLYLYYISWLMFRGEMIW
jgi:hypothetical protein